jgi:ABC-type tungstate transport system permease subunit
MRKFIRRAVAMLGLVLPAVTHAAAPSTQSTTLAITLVCATSIDSSGLLAAILPEFTQATGISVRVLALGTSQALDAARRGDADLVLDHDPEGEQKFLDDGNGLNPRQIAWNVEGDPHLIKRLDVIELNPAKHPDAKLAAAKALADWLASPAGQAAIGGYRVDGKQLFNPSAAARVPSSQRFD